jgi:hypothetical protein
MIPPDIDMMIMQVSRPQDRAEAEIRLTDEGMIPITLFADGPDKAFLVGARHEDLASAFEAARARAQGYGADRLALRMRTFSDLSDAINTQFKYLADPVDFPNAVALLFVEALVQIGMDSPDQLVPCAVRFLRNNLEAPDFETAPEDDPAAAGQPDSAA